LNRSHGFFEEVSIEFFESGSGKDFREINTVIKGFNFNFGFVGGRKSSFGFFNFSLKFLDGSLVLS